MNTTDISQLIQAYLQVFPEEKAGLAGFAAHSNSGDEGIFFRKTLPGHVTAAGFVIARDSGRVLLIEHAFLKRYLQPGGHYEPGDKDTIATAKREIEEESGLTDDELTYVPIKPDQPLVPLDLEVHAIPANPAKQEAPHVHYDFRYVFTVEAESEVTLDSNESTAFRWTDMAAFAASGVGFRRVVQKFERFKLLG